MEPKEFSAWAAFPVLLYVTTVIGSDDGELGKKTLSYSFFQIFICSSFNVGLGHA